jgi:hypothetical protein
LLMMTLIAYQVVDVDDVNTAVFPLNLMMTI